MKSCKKFEAGLYIYADRLEKENMPVEFSGHLEHCERCRILYASLERIETTIAEIGEVPLPPESYFEHLPAKILAKLPAETGARKGFAFSAWLAGFFARPLVKPVLALAVFALIAITVWQYLPEGAKFTFVDNRKKLPRAKQEQPAETTQQAEVLATGESEPDKILNKSTIPQEQKAPAVAGLAASKNVSATQSGGAKPDSADALLAQGNLRQQPQAEVPAAPSNVADLALRATPPERLENVRLAEGAAKQAEKTPLTPEALKALQEELQKSQKMAATSGRIRSKAKETANLETLGRANFASFEQGAATFSYHLRLAQLADSEQERAAIWRRFLETTQDSTQYALGLVQLARANYAVASQSPEVYELANAVDWFEENAAALKPLMGKEDFNRQLAELQARLQKARTGKLRKE
jgi:hypothetical protein